MASRQFWFVPFVLAALYATSTNAQDTKDEPATTVAPVPKATTLAPTDIICRVCSCDDLGNVFCNNRDVAAFFTTADWDGLKIKKPRTVDLSDNTFANVTPISELPIQILNISNCDIVNIARGSFMNLQELKILDLSHNALNSANLSPHAFEGRYSPEKFEPLESLRVLDLSYNQLHSLNQDLFEHVSELTELYLTGNPLTIIDHVTMVAISSLPDLKVLDLKGCGLKEIPKNFLHTPKFLEVLDLSDNSLEVVPDALAETTNLKHLSLNNNLIRFIAHNSGDYNGFPVMPKLEEVHLCFMDNLEEILEHSMGGLTALKILHVSHNRKLTYIAPNALSAKDDKGALTWPPIREIYLSANNLSSIPSSLVGRWDTVQKLELGFNPLLCDCSTQWMVDTLVPFVNADRVNASKDLICREPIEMRGKTMQQLNERHTVMRCSAKYAGRSEQDGVLLMGALIGVLLAVPICLTIVLLYKRGYFAPCGVRGPADFSRAFYKRTNTDDFNFS